MTAAQEPRAGWLATTLGRAAVEMAARRMAPYVIAALKAGRSEDDIRAVLTARPSESSASVGGANPLAGAFTTVESVGHEEPDYRVATIKMRFEGGGASERAHTALNYLSKLHEADLRTQAPAREGEVEEAARAAYRACMSAWSCGEPYHRVKAMMDAMDRLGIALAEPGAAAALSRQHQEGEGRE